MHEEKTKKKVKQTEVRERDKKMNSNFEYYRIFYYVAKYGNLTKAASALQTSQPAVTRTMQIIRTQLLDSGSDTHTPRKAVRSTPGSAAPP